MIRLFASDMDGTLLNDEGYISDRTINAVKKLQKHGIHFIVNTGRDYRAAKGELDDKLHGLSIGAEDYIVKPFEILELIARINVVLRRTKKNDDVFRISDVEVHLDRHDVFKNGERVQLAPQEYELLEVLILNRNMAMSREKLLELAWGWDYMGDTKTVDVHIRKLRKKLGLEKKICTINKLGYRLETE